METIEIILKILEIAAVLVIATGGMYFLLFKKKLTQFRAFIVSVDDALYDDKVTEDEFRMIYESAKKLIGK